MNAPAANNSIFQQLKPHVSLIGAVCTSIVFIIGMVFNYSGQNQHSKDIQTTQSQQIEDTQAQLKNLQIQVNKDDVLLAVIEQFRSDTTKKLDRIEGLVLQDIRSSKPQR